MSLSLGIFDVFSYAVPGSLYLALGAYIAGRLHWIDVVRLIHGPSVLVIGGIVVASYLLGFVTYPLASAVDRLLSLRRPGDDARAEFLARTPAAQDRLYVRAHMGLLQAATEVLAADVSQGIPRLVAVGIMTRNCAVPLLLGGVTAVISAIAGIHVGPDLVVAGLCAAAAAAAIWQARRFRHWANIKTLEICYWIPDIDDKLGQPSRGPVKPNAARPRRPAAPSVPPPSPPAPGGR